jgi:hypothetical protein
MSHPKDRRHRFLIGKKKGEVRGYRYWNGMHYVKDLEERRKSLEMASYKRRNTTKLCSCSMCGNPRRVALKDKLTMQEKKFFESLKY